MILVWAVVLGVVGALVRYRRQAFSRIAAIPLHSAWLVLLAVALQIPILRSPSGPPEELVLQQGLFLASHLLLLVFVWLNRHIFGIVIVGIGVILNLAAILFNTGYMPITPQTLVRINPGSSIEDWQEGHHYGYSKDIIRNQDDTQLWALSDILILPPPFPQPTAFSMGDLVIAAGIIILLMDIKPGKKNKTIEHPT